MTSGSSATDSVIIGKATTTSSSSTNSVVIGQGAGENSTGAASTIMGYYAGQNCTGFGNVLLGYTCGVGSPTNCAGTDNVGIGHSALEDLAGTVSSNGSENIGIGGFSGRNITTGARNVTVGSRAGSSVTTGVDNTFIGGYSGKTLTDGVSCTCVGHDTGVSGASASFQTAIGGEAVCTADNQVMLGRASGADTVVIPGNVTAVDLDLSGGIYKNSKPLIQSGTAITPASGSDFNAPITFATQFSSTPIITANAFKNSAHSADQYYCNIRGVTNSGASIRVVDRDGDGVHAATIHWVATQL